MMMPLRIGSVLLIASIIPCVVVTAMSLPEIEPSHGSECMAVTDRPCDSCIAGKGGKIAGILDVALEVDHRSCCHDVTSLISTRPLPCYSGWRTGPQCEIPLSFLGFAAELLVLILALLDGLRPTGSPGPLWASDAV